MGILNEEEIIKALDRVTHLGTRYRHLEIESARIGAKAQLEALSSQPDEKLVEPIANLLSRRHHLGYESARADAEDIESLFAPIMAAREQELWYGMVTPDEAREAIEQARVEERKAAEDVIRATGFTGIFQRQEWQEYVRLAHLRSGEQPRGE